MVQLKRERRVDLGQLEVTVRLPARTADRVSQSMAYRKLFRPAARTAYHALKRGRSHGRPAQVLEAPGSQTPVFPAEPPRPEDLDPEAIALIQRIAPLEWYHTIDLGHGVVTPGFVDHRDQLPLYHLPDSLAGLRCLDIGTFDGFFAFEMEKRGAAEVVASDIAQGIDCDLPRTILVEARNFERKEMGSGFRLARDILGSKVRHEVCSVYDLSPERVGKFDFIVLSDLLLHLRDPQLALERVASVCRGTAIIADVFTPFLERYGDLCLSLFVPWLPSYTWWLPNTNTLKKMMTIAGFEPVEELSRFTLHANNEAPIHKVVLRGSIPARPQWKNVLAADGIVSTPDVSDADHLAGGRRFAIGPLELTVRRSRDSAPGTRTRPSARALSPGPHSDPCPIIEPTTDEPRARAIRERIAAIDWYHTLDLGDGVVTPGFVDHRALVAQHRLPSDLTGKRCLDVATFDGFWAFEMEKRGASEVVATDVATGKDCDVPKILLDEIVHRPTQREMGRGFKVARELLESSVVYEVCNVYDLAPDRLGTFDFVFVSDLLLHLRDPQLALECIRSVCRGTIILADAYSPLLETYGEYCLSQFVPWEWIGNYTWWLPNTRTLSTMLTTAGFDPVTELTRFSYTSRAGNPVAKVVFQGTATGEEDSTISATFASNQEG